MILRKLIVAVTCQKYEVECFNTKTKEWSTEIVDSSKTRMRSKKGNRWEMHFEDPSLPLNMLINEEKYNQLLQKELA